MTLAVTHLAAQCVDSIFIELGENLGPDCKPKRGGSRTFACEADITSSIAYRTSDCLRRLGSVFQCGCHYCCPHTRAATTLCNHKCGNARFRLPSSWLDGTSYPTVDGLRKFSMITNSIHDHLWLADRYRYSPRRSRHLYSEILNSASRQEGHA